MQTSAVVPLILPAHIAAGALAIIVGYVALYATKGASLHRRAGMIFVYAMVTMSLSGAVMEALTDFTVSVNVIAGLLTFYFVATSLLTVRRPPEKFAWVDRVAVVLALVVGALAFRAGIGLMSTGRPEMMPVFIFGLVAMLGAVGDLRWLRGGPLTGSPRLKRHLWRMCFAMWVAAASFFWGPPTRVPEMLRIPVLQAVAVLIPIAAMVYWLFRLRRRARTWPKKVVSSI